MLEKIKKYLQRKLKEYKKDKSEKEVTMDLILNIVLTVLMLDASYYLFTKYSYNKKAMENPIYKLEQNATEIKTSDANFIKTLEEANYVYFVKSVKDIKILSVNDNNTTNIIKDVPELSISMNIEKKLVNKAVDYKWIKAEEEEFKPVIISFITNNILYILIFGYLIYMLKESGALGNRDKFEIYKPKDIEGLMRDIIGYEDIKEEISHFEQMFKYQKKYKGYGIEETFNLMFSGPAGTGKTKIATLLAKELELPILVSSGNLETGYVGGGAKVIKSLYKNAETQAKSNKNRACIVFIDEGQNLLKKRGVSREKWADDTNNELLAHLDGIKTNSNINIITIIASNFDESNIQLDEAMARRFKKKIHFRTPNLEERIELIKFFLRRVSSSKKDKNMNIDNFAKSLSGITPAVIETIIQEAGMIAINNKEKINEDNLLKAFETILVGKSDRKTTKGKEKEREIISTHEIGHFIVNFCNTMKTNNGDIEKTKEDIKVIKISSESISRANALGYVLSENNESLLNSVKDFENEVRVLYGGVATEEVIFGKNNITAGSANDIEKATSILKYMYEKCSIYDDFKIDFGQLKNDEEIRNNIVKKSSELYKETKEIVENNKDLIKYLSNVLLEKWVLSKDEIFAEIQKFKEK